MEVRKYYSIHVNVLIYLHLKTFNYEIGSFVIVKAYLSRVIICDSSYV